MSHYLLNNNKRGNSVSKMSDFIIEKEETGDWHEDWDSYWDHLHEYRTDVDSEVMVARQADM